MGLGRTLDRSWERGGGRLVCTAGRPLVVVGGLFAPLLDLVARTTNHARRTADCYDQDGDAPLS